MAEGVDTALALADLIRKTDKSYRIDLKYAIIFGGGWWIAAWEGRLSTFFLLVYFCTTRAVTFVLCVL